MKTIIIFKKLCLWLGVIILLTACNQVVELNLPKYENQLVMEFYLEDGLPLRAAIQESINYTDTALISIVSNALVVLSYNNQNDTLLNAFEFDSRLGKVYNYTNPKIMQLQENVTYSVYVKDQIGRELRGTTTYKKPIVIDSAFFRYNDAGKASAVAVFQDPANETNYYRLLSFKDSIVPTSGDRWDARFRDITFNGEQFSFNTGFSYLPGDTVISTLYSLTPEHYFFSESAGAARGANFNPFGQPAAIKSNVTGGIGIFTTLSYDRRIMIVP